MTREMRILTLPLMMAAVALSACSDAPAGLDPEQAAMQRVLGSYIVQDGFGAIKFTVTIDGETTDVNAQGAKLNIDLAPDGTTTGRLFLPGLDEDGGDMDADLTGRWSMQGDTVRFEHRADTFIRDMPFVVQQNRLEGDATFGEARVRVTLVKR